ncbi:hypothetical protein BGZ97_003249 [Linnemannia gamsii]|uniref:Uncharacterized protein n=1 Tax=Linnemannia gamsii TaxID=64522 RepID=A0A9P6RJB9_9FUNG|nr:hypothetical protein BGZ97_003249 [Linnemannia gamsii]
MIEFLLWTITNLRKPLVSFKHSIEANARAVFNIVIASIIDGAGLLKNSYEDVEFRSLVQRVAKKIGSRPPVSPLEQLKFRMYQYLQGTVSDPSRYIRPELIAKVSSKCDPFSVAKPLSSPRTRGYLTWKA